MTNVFYVVILMAVVAYSGSDAKNQSKAQKDSNESSNKEELPVRPCIDYKPGMDLDETPRDTRDLEQKSTCMPWCSDWVTHDWWEKCAWDRCNTCTECNGIEFCRPMQLIAEGGCAEIFKPMKWSPKTVPPDIATAKYTEFCKNEEGEKPYNIGFLGIDLGPCEGANCECRANPVCNDWTVNAANQGAVKEYTMAGTCRPVPNADCCKSDSCLQNFVRTELVEAEIDDAFCFSFFAQAGADWYDIAGGLFKEKKLAKDENGATMGTPDQLFFYRGDMTPGFVGKSMTAKTPGQYFVGFFPGSYDRTGGTVLGATIKLQAFSKGKAPPPCSETPPDGSLCTGDAGDLEGIDEGKAANCCNDYYIFRKNTCKKGPELAPCNLSQVGNEMIEEVKILSRKFEKVKETLLSLRKNIKEFEEAGDVNAPPNEALFGDTTRDVPDEVEIPTELTVDTNTGDLIEVVIDTNTEEKVIITTTSGPPPISNVTITVEMNLDHQLQQEFCGLLSEVLKGEVEDCDYVEAKHPKEAEDKLTYRDVLIVIIFETEKEADAAKEILEEKIKWSLDTIKRSKPSFNVRVKDLGEGWLIEPIDNSEIHEEFDGEHIHDHDDKKAKGVTMDDTNGSDMDDIDRFRDLVEMRPRTYEQTKFIST